MDINEIRRLYPDTTKDLSDADIVTKMSEATGQPVDYVAGRLGVQINEPGFGSSFRSGLASFPVGAGRILEDMGATDIGGSMRRYGEDVQFRNPASVTSFGEFFDNPIQGFKEFSGQALGTTLPALIPYIGPAGRAASVGATGLRLGGGAAISSVPAYGDIREDQEQQGFSDPAAAAGGAAATGLIEQFGGIQRVLRPSPGGSIASGFSRSPVRTGIRQGIRTILEEGAEELVQSPIQQLAAGRDPTDPEQLYDTAFSGFAGAVGGIGFGGFGGMRAGAQHSRYAQLYDEAHAEEQRRIAEQLARSQEVDLLSQAPIAPPPYSLGGFGTTFQEVQDPQGGVPFDTSTIYDPAPTQSAPDLELSAAINPYDMGGHVSRLQGDAETGIVQPQFGLFGGGGDVGFGRQLAPTQSVAPQRQMAPAAPAAVMPASTDPAVAPVQAQARKGKAAQPDSPYVQMYRELNPQFQPDKKMKWSPYLKRLADMKSDEEALDFIRDKVINSKDIGQATQHTLEEMHKRISGKTITQWMNEQEEASASNQTAPAGVAQTQGTRPVQEVQAEEAQAGQSAAVENTEDAEPEVRTRPFEEGEAMQWVLAEMQRRDPLKTAVFEAATGLNDGNARTSREIVDELRNQGVNISESRVRQMVADGRKIFQQIVKDNNISLEELRGPQEQKQEDVAAPRQASELVETKQGEDAGTADNTGFTVDTINKVNEDRTVQKVDKDQDAAAKAVESADADQMAEAVWDAHVHALAAQGQKERSWEQLKKTPKGRETIKAFREFWNKIQDSPNKDIAASARFRKITKEDYFHRGSIEKGELGTAHAGFVQAFLELEKAGQLGLLDMLQSIEIRSESDTELDGANASVVGIQSGNLRLLVNERLLESQNPAWVAHVLRHEVAHIADFHGGLKLGRYSHTQAMVNAVVEVMPLVASKPLWTQALQYPFGDKYQNLSRPVFLAEFFAQVQSLWHNSKTVDKGLNGRQVIQRDAPKLAALLRDINDDIKAEVEAAQAQAGRGGDRGRDQGATGDGETSGGLLEGSRVPGRQDSQQRGDGRGRPEVSGTPETDGDRLDSRGEAPAYLSYPQELQTGPKLITQAVQDTVRNWSKKGLQAIAFGHDLANIAVREGLTSAKGFFDILHRKSATRTRLEAELDNMLEQSAALPDRKAVNAFLKMSTTKQVWGYQPKWRDKVKVDPVAEAAYKRLSPEGKKLVDDVFRHGEETHSQVQQLLNQEINAEYDAQLKNARTQGERNRIERDRQRKLRVMGRRLPKIEGPYAPLGRFGDYVAVGKSQAYIDAERANDVKALEQLQSDPDHYVVEFYNNYWEAKARSREFQKFFAYADGFEKQKIYKEIQEVPWSAIAKVKGAIEDSSADDKTKAAMNRLVTDLYLTMMVESSARKSEIRRKAITGADRDMLRSFASQGRAMAHFISSLQHNPEVSAHISAMQNEARDGEQGSRDNRTRVLNEIMGRYAQGLDYRPTPLSDKAMRVTSFFMLVTSPAYYVQNSLQTGMLTLPMLNARFGAGPSWRELYRAYRDVARSAKFTGNSLDIDKMDIVESEKQLLRRLRDDGKLDITIAQDLGRWSEGESITDRGTFGKVMRKIWALPQRLEMVNRITSALAAHRLGGNYDYAAHLIDLTHGNYSASNAPRFMQGSGLRKLVFQFRKYQLIQMSLIGNLVHGSFGNVSAEEKAVARTALKWIMAHHMVMAGALGLPASNIVGMVLGVLGADDDEPANAERMLRKAIGDEGLADLLLRGLPAALGVNLSERIGMDNAFSILPFTDVNLLDRKGYQETMVGLGGAFLGGMLPRWADGAGLIAKGDYYKGIEMMLPRGLRDMARAYRFGSEGVTQRNNDVAMTPDEISLFDVMTQAVGLPSTTLTGRQRRYGDVIEMQNYYRGRTGEIRHRYAKAYRENDMEEMRDLREEWVAVAEAMRRNGLKPQPLSNLLRAPQEQRKREGNMIRGVPTTGANRGFVEMNAGL